jgi:spore coat protein U-like protein
MTELSQATVSATRHEIPKSEPSARRFWKTSKAWTSAGATAFGAVSLGLASGPAAAATATATMAVTATVQATCLISVAPMAFGVYTGVISTATAVITTTCTNTTPYTIGLSAGLGTTPAATVTTRHMMSGTVGLNYQLTQDAAYATNWGNTPVTDTPASLNGTGAAVPVTVYGRIAAGQFVTPGAFTDTITATVNY